MTLAVGINGFGRIGRLTARLLLRDPERFEVRLVNDLADADLLGHLFQHDSTYGSFAGEVEAREPGLAIDGRSVRVTAEREPEKIPWKDAGVEVVLESTGAFRRREDLERHLAAGAGKVLLSASPKGEAPLDAQVVLGVNDDVLEDGHRLVSNASCTTNCLAPMLKVLHERFGVEEALMTTVHAYTPSQHLLDGIAKDPRRARSATRNLIPTTTGASKATVQVMPELEGRLEAIAVRVPVVTGSLVDLDVRLSKEAGVDAVNGAMREAAAGPLRGVLDYTERPIVSSDIVGDPHSCIVDGSFTRSLGGRAVKVLGWYDNEWGYAARCVDMIDRLGRLS